MNESFEIDRLDYELPSELIAQQPLPGRASSRLLLVERNGLGLDDAAFGDFPGLLNPGDLLVLNDTRVVPAKFRLRRKTGGRIEGLFLAEPSPGVWEVLLSGAGRVKQGEQLVVEPEQMGFMAKALGRGDGGRWSLEISPPAKAEEVLERIGQPPLPPYIHRDKQYSGAQQNLDRSRYQTVFAQQPGAVAAPTAGLHFDEATLSEIQERGVSIAFATLHVGMGTFAPLKVDDLSQHTMHTERYELPERTAQAIAGCRERGGRVIAVGTTSLRVLETCAASDGLVNSGNGQTNLFCYPPYRFAVVDALLTNFHLPRSTLLALVMAFAGEERIQKAYQHAVEQEYRFFSYGDAMFIA